MTTQWNFSDEIGEIIKFRDDRDWKKFHYPKDLAAALSIEVAELQELFLWKSQEPPEQIISDPDRMNDITEEIADIAIYLFLLTHGLNIDLKQSIKRKIKKNALKYPV